MNTAAVILAAGRGSRMRDLTADRPKCLLKLAGKALLDWQLDTLHAAGIENILVVKGYKGEMIQGNFESAVNPRWAESNMLSTLLCADEFMHRSFKNGVSQVIVSYSDIVYHPDHVRKLATCDADLAIAYDTEWRKLWEMRFDDVLSDAETFFQQDGYLKTIGNRAKDLSEIQGQYMGLIKINASGWQAIKNVCASLGSKTDSTDMTSFLRLALAREIPVGAVAINGKWCEADNAFDLTRYEEAVAKGNWTHDWREK